MTHTLKPAISPFILLVGLLVWSPPMAFAQVSEPAAIQLPRLAVLNGDTVRVMTADGRTRKGMFVAQGVDALRVAFGGSETTVPAAELLQVDVLVREGVKDGLLRGLLIGGVGGAVFGGVAASTCEGFCVVSRQRALRCSPESAPASVPGSVCSPMRSIMLA